MHGQRANRSLDEAIRRIANRQGGVVSRAQLLALAERGAVEHRIATGRLRVVHRGVYSVGHDAIPVRGRLVAGLLVAGAGAALSHRTAAYVLTLLPSMPPFVEITTAKRAPRNRPGLVFHHATNLETTRRHDLPLTTAIRTLRDLAVTHPRQVERAASEALVLELVTAEQIGGQQGRGSAALRRIVDELVAPTRSELERRFVRAMVRAGLPRPIVNERIGRHRVDFHWPAQLLVVEVDGWRFHGHRLAFERDRVRDAELQLGGWAVVRFTWRQLRHEPAAVAARVALLLSRPALRRAS